MQRQGLYPPPPGASSIIGLECAGEVIEVGDLVYFAIGRDDLDVQTRKLGVMEFCETEFDITFEAHGVQVVIDKKSEFFMGGTILDFNDDLLNRGFAFKNPSATGTCGCGMDLITAS